MKISLEAKEMTLLGIISEMGGIVESSDHPYCWLNWFCNDEVHNKHSDTFNRCHENGWLFTTHNTDFEISTTTLTDAGKAALTAALASAAEPEVKIMPRGGVERNWWEEYQSLLRRFKKLAKVARQCVGHVNDGLARDLQEALPETYDEHKARKNLAIDT